jgi:hypothetical protein
VRDRYREEWLSHYDESPGTFAKLQHAVGCSVASVAIAMIAEKTKSRQKEIHEFHSSVNSAVDRILSKLPEGWRLAARLTDADQKEHTDFLQRVEAGLRLFRQQLDETVRLGCPPTHMAQLRRLIENLDKDTSAPSVSFCRRASSADSGQGSLF